MSENVNLPSGATASVEKGVEQKTLDALDEAAICLMKAMDAANPFLPKEPKNALTATIKLGLIALEAAKEAFFEAKSMAMHAEIIQRAIDNSHEELWAEIQMLRRIQCEAAENWSANYVKREDVRPLLEALARIHNYPILNVGGAANMQDIAGVAIEQARQKGLRT